MASERASDEFPPLTVRVRGICSCWEGAGGTGLNGSPCPGRGVASGPPTRLDQGPTSSVCLAQPRTRMTRSQGPASYGMSALSAE
eukprot:2862947-Pleurochrysis_carterae.AAC.1